jgi:hypothetical protein
VRSVCVLRAVCRVLRAHVCVLLCGGGSCVCARGRLCAARGAVSLALHPHARARRFAARVCAPRFWRQRAPHPFRRAAAPSHPCRWPSS